MGMYRVSKRIEVAGSHKLDLNYESKCSNLHGHNWIITVTCEAEDLDVNGMVVDFAAIKQLVSESLDHKNLNEVEPFNRINPTAENIAKWLCDKIAFCVEVSVQESEGNIASYRV